ncbi:carboxypeptidase-like regulatory domain-containing protein [Pedobacter sp. L105]|uniref:carboxypeptidase-like regulatory domain-containing protein n=1 Tax=Pedobacter sp. L105 TaxID=1641871 RepID=UPI00131C1FF8|nr:carboxypeptidase-like regulatory domain-containing protein [Pedobacter sp. L105]
MKYTHFAFCLVVLFLSLLTADIKAQNNLDRNITLNVKQAKLSELLSLIGKSGGFYFSYSSDQIRADSLVTLSADHSTVRNLLDGIFKGNVDYKESPGYIILRPAPNRLSLRPDTTSGKENNYYITGYVVDDRTGLGIPNASVYEKRLLVSTLTNNKGFFSIRIKSDGQITLTVSKEFYKDASVNFLSDVTISLKQHNSYYSGESASDRTERNWLGRIFISSRARMQRLNLGGFITSVPFQTSFLPGLSSHGMMSSQVVNHYSLNVLGGYTAGLDGIELGGLFNLNKQDAQYVQAAGLFNVVGGNFKGVELAGISNTVLKNVNGLQAAGIYNLAKDSITGMQLAGIMNISNEVNGFQAAGILNKSHLMTGVSFGLVNITDTLDGYAIGLLNLSRNGYHQLLVYSNEVTTANLAFKTGNGKLYAVISTGAHLGNHLNYYSFGLGIGHDFIFNQHYYLSTEIASQSLLSGQWNDQHQIFKFNTLFNVKTGTTFSFFAGPSFNLYHLQKGEENAEDREIICNKIGLMNLGKSNRGWIGWSVGLSF